MARTDPNSGGFNQPLRPAPENQRTQPVAYSDETPTVVPGDGGGTGHEPFGDESLLGRWVTRYRHWHNGFEQEIGPKYRKYWGMYRAFDNQPVPGPNQQWRDRTVIPECFKVLETRLPRIVMAQFGGREWFAVQGRDAEDSRYEKMVQRLIQSTIDEIGNRSKSGGFIQRMVDGLRYREITGHVWFKVYWRTETQWYKTKKKMVTEDGEEVWQPIEVYDLIYDNVDVEWLPLDSVAVDLSGANKWKIERIETSLEALQWEQDNHKKETGENLYDPAALEALVQYHQSSTGMVSEMPEEPRDTEHWPIGQETVEGNPGETPVELWLCWDNLEKTLTKIANRSVLLDHGMAPTPDGLDPIISSPSLAIPGRIYGESILHYIGPLAAYQTRIARARADEVLLGIWQQYIFREGAVKNSQFFFTPGGAMEIEAPYDRPLSDSVTLLPRKPIMPEAYNEETYRQSQAEAAAGADRVSQGVEATAKSRDVSATEIQQRVLQGASRYQLENLYTEETFKKPLLQKVFDLLRQHMTRSRTVEVLGEQMQVDLADLERPIDIVVGGGIREYTKVERQQQMQQLIQLSSNPAYEPYFKKPQLLEELLKDWDWRDTDRLIRSEDEVKQELQKRLAQQQALAAGQDQQGQGGAPSQSPNQAGPTNQAANVPGMSEGGGGETPDGGSPRPSPAGSDTGVVEI
jgi:hypothetical protein